MTTLADITSSKELLTNLTLRELRSKYKRSILGWTWSMLNPLASMLIYTLVFAFFLKIEIPPGQPSGLSIFALYLVCGLLPWNYLANGLLSGMESLISNANLIKKVYFPREVLVAATIASFLVSFLIEMGVLLVALLVAGNMVLPWLPPLIVIVAIQSVFVLGLALLLSVLNVYFRDVRHLVAIALQMWFYLTPIVYPVTLVPRRTEILGQEVPARALYELNPMVGFVEAYRDVLYHLRMPAMGTMAYLVGVSIVTLGLGIATFARLQPRLAEEL
jgi:ABC-2 type transport system permease protein